jgi:hypothetical protein
MSNITSRNDLAKYSYFFVAQNNKRTLSQLAMTEFLIYEFENPVTAARGVAYLTSEYTTNIYELTDDLYKKGTFSHPKYRNQKNEYLQFNYSDLPVNIITVDLSRNL